MASKPADSGTFNLSGEARKGKEGEGDLLSTYDGTMT
jgi:hypothetical protein